jgi:Antitoxin SocA-like, Panacea domain
MASRTMTLKVDLPGGQDRLKQMILYVAHQCVTTKRFGGIKLNKIVWKAYFDAFATRGAPVTGRPYQRLKLGPAPKEMVPIRREMLRDRLIRIEKIDFGDDIVEHRTIALVEPNMTHFDDDDISFVDAAIRHYWDKTGREASDDSHGPAWASRSDQDPMPYESALLSPRRPRATQMERLKQLVFDRGLLSE